MSEPLGRVPRSPARDVLRLASDEPPEDSPFYPPLRARAPECLRTRGPGPGGREAVPARIADLGRPEGQGVTPPPQATAPRPHEATLRIAPLRGEDELWLA